MIEGGDTLLIMLFRLIKSTFNALPLLHSAVLMHVIGILLQFFEATLILVDETASVLLVATQVFGTVVTISRYYH